MQGTTVGAGVDLAPSCLTEPSAVGGDVAYSFTLAAPSSVSIDVLSQTEFAVALLRAPCGAGDELACADDRVFGETLSVPFLDAGDYRIIVAANGDGHGGASTGPFSLALDVGPPQCLGDAHDPEDDVLAGARELGAADLGVSGGRLCPGDVDLFVVEHLGGILSLDAATATAQVNDALLDGAGIVVGVGAAVDLGAALPAGLYLVSVTAPAATLADPVSYTLQVSHGCPGDAADHATPRTDDLAAPTLLADPVVLTGRALACGDIDAVRVSARAAGIATLRLTDAAGIAVTAAGGTITDDGADRLITMALLPGASLDVVIGPTAGVPLTYDLALTWEWAPPSNDVCSGAVALTLPTALDGSTLGAASDRNGACNGDGSAPEPGVRGGDVFYLLPVAAPTSLELLLSPRDPAFAGTVELYGPVAGGACADLSAVPALGCATGRVRAELAAAGDYVVVVESRAGRFFQGAILPPSPGTFSLTVTGYPAGFPAPEACGLAIEIAAPTNEPALVEVPPAAFSAFNDAQGSCGGPTPEAVVSLTAALDGEVEIRSLPYSFDTLLHVRQGDCADGLEVACNDDADQRFETESEVRFVVTAGERYFVFVDGFGVLPPGAGAELTVRTVP